MESYSIRKVICILLSVEIRSIQDQVSGKTSTTPVFILKHIDDAFQAYFSLLSSRA